MITQFKNDKNSLEQGMVLVWSGLVSDIPPGFVLCDGNNGTMDLTDQMLQGTSPSSPNVGATGGSDSTTLSSSQLSNHGHNLSIGTHNGHRHPLSFDPEEISNFSGYSQPTYPDGNNSNNGYNTSYSGSHSHNHNTDATGSSNSIDNRPSFYRIAFITRP